MSENENHRQPSTGSPQAPREKEVPASMRWMRRIKKMFSFLFTSCVLLAHRGSWLSRLFAYSNTARHQNAANLTNV